MLVDTKLNDREIAQLIAFLSALTSDERYAPPALP
jgi:hypothetical protein